MTNIEDIKIDYFVPPNGSNQITYDPAHIIPNALHVVTLFLKNNQTYLY